MPRAEFYDLFLGHHSDLFSGFDQVDLVSYDDLAELIGGSLLNLSKPALQIAKGLAVGQIEHYYSPLTFSVVGGSDRPVLFGPRYMMQHLQVSQRFILTSWPRARTFVGAYSTPMVGGGFCPLFRDRLLTM